MMEKTTHETVLRDANRGGEIEVWIEADGERQDDLDAVREAVKRTLSGDDPGTSRLVEELRELHRRHTSVDNNEQLGKFAVESYNSLLTDINGLVEEHE